MPAPIVVDRRPVQMCSSDGDVERFAALSTNKLLHWAHWNAAPHLPPPGRLVERRENPQTS